ncbi:Uncharacterised protein [Campylobacter jejuni subsp. doylei]|nr:Uncharacterised protein [Campylobacter jejuni subsp. doylei]
MDEFANKCGDLMMRSDGVIIGGGGAYFLDQEYIKEMHPNIILAPSPHEFSNVRGYYKKALLKVKDEVKKAREEFLNDKFNKGEKNESRN